MVTLTMTRERALEIGLLHCSGGHPESNHFEDGGCARCPGCEGYEEQGRSGVELKKPAASLSQEATRLREAALLYGKVMAGCVVSSDDPEGMGLNARLLEAAMSYADEVRSRNLSDMPKILVDLAGLVRVEELSARRHADLANYCHALRAQGRSEGVAETIRFLGFTDEKRAGILAALGGK